MSDSDRQFETYILNLLLKGPCDGKKEDQEEVQQESVSK